MTEDIIRLAPSKVQECIDTSLSSLLKVIGDRQTTNANEAQQLIGAAEGARALAETLRAVLKHSTEAVLDAAVQDVAAAVDEGGAHAADSSQA